MRTLSGHEACVLSLAVSGQFFFSGSYDTTIKVSKKNNDDDDFWTFTEFSIIIGMEYGKFPDGGLAAPHGESGGTPCNWQVCHQWWHW